MFEASISCLVAQVLVAPVLVAVVLKELVLVAVVLLASVLVALVANSHYCQSRGIDSTGELLRQNCDSFLLLVFLNGWETEEDQEEQEECNMMKNLQGRNQLCHSLC